MTHKLLSCWVVGLGLIALVLGWATGAGLLTGLWLVMSLVLMAFIAFGYLIAARRFG